MTQSKPVLISCSCGHTVPAMGDTLPKSVPCERCGRVISVPTLSSEIALDDSIPYLTATVSATADSDETIIDKKLDKSASASPNHTPASRASRAPSSSANGSSVHTQIQGAMAVKGAMGLAGGAGQVDFATQNLSGEINGVHGSGGFSGMSRLAGIDLAQRFTPASEATAPQVDDPQNAAIYGIHLIIRNHAKGGMGRIAVAYDQFLKREVALKELRPDVMDDLSVVHRFVSEAEITAQLEHPGIVPVHVLGLDAEGHPYYTMKLIRGRTLQEAIKDYHKKPDKATLLWLVRRLVAASQPISFAHDRGVIHRDIKPANIMFGEHNETLVMDWGLAKVYRSESASGSSSRASSPDDDAPLSSAGFQLEGGPVASSAGEETVASNDSFSTQHNQEDGSGNRHATVDHITMVGTVVGTPAFMSPEQATPGSTQVGPQTDVYGMGAILYTILTGRPPFTGKSGNEVLEKVRRQTPLPAIQVAKQLKKNVPAALSAICEKAMARDLDSRYATINDFTKDLCHWLDDEPVSAMPWTPWTPWASLLAFERRWRVFTVGAVVTVICVLVTAEIFWGYIDRMSQSVSAIAIEMQKPHDLLQVSRSRVSLVSGDSPSRFERVQLGESSAIRVETIGASKTTLLMTSPASDGTKWDFSQRKHVTFSLFPHTRETGRLTGLEIKLGCGGNYFHYSLTPENMLAFGSNAWNKIVVPLEPSPDEAAWNRQITGEPTLASIDWIELTLETTGEKVIDIQNFVVGE